MMAILATAGRFLGMEFLGNPIRWIAILIGGAVAWIAVSSLVTWPERLVDRGHAAGIQQCKQEQLELEKLMLLEQLESAERALADQREAIEGANNERIKLEKQITELSATAGAADSRCVGDSFLRKLEAASDKD